MIQDLVHCSNSNEGGGHMDTCMQFIPHNARKKKAEMQTQEDS